MSFIDRFIYYNEEHMKEIFITLTSILLALFVGIYFLSGLIHVRKGEIAILTKMGKYVKTLDEGWHYAIPPVFDDWRHLSLSDTKFSVNLADGRIISFLGKVVDYPLFYKSKGNYSDSIRLWLQAGADLEQIKEQLPSIGMVVNGSLEITEQ